MEKDIDRISKNADTDIIIRIDDFGGKRGVTIREFVKGERYTGFTKAGTRIPVDKFKAFKDAINSISEKDLLEGLENLVPSNPQASQASYPSSTQKAPSSSYSKPKAKSQKALPKEERALEEEISLEDIDGAEI